MLKNEKPGFIMIIASLLVIGLTAYIFTDYQLVNREKQSREQGLALARLMSGMPWKQVISQPGSKGLLEAFKQGQNNPDFAYGVILDINGTVKTEVTSPGIITPLQPAPEEPSSWLGQRTVAGIDKQAYFLESHAPLFSNGEHMGFVKLGYIKPELKFGYADLPFIATISLPIFLLTPLFYYFLRQEIRPLKKISQSIEQLIENPVIQPMQLEPSTELGNFMDRFNQFIDITQTRIKDLNTEQEDLVMSSKLLAYKNNKVESILQTLPEAILVIDEAGEVSYANEKVTQLLGLERDRILHKKPVHWCKNQEINNLLSGQHQKGVMLNATSKDFFEESASQEKNLEIRVYPLFSPMKENRLLGRLVVIRDVTEQLYDQQRQGEFISQISHELKTPLNVLSMYSESLLDNELTSEEHRTEAANVIHDEVERLANLIQNLLSISQYELGGLQVERQRVRLADFLTDIFENLEKSDRSRDLKFELDLPNELSAVNIDKALMRIAVNNLLTNAIKYSKEGGLIILEAVESAQYIDIRVIDEGFGISETDQAHVFDKFFRSEDSNIREKTGHGLGLSLTQQIVNIHQAEISLSSTLGKGSQFQIRLDKDQIG